LTRSAVASDGSKGDSYDNAMAEAFNSLYKAELVRNKGPWRGLDDLEMATVEYIDWYNNRRLHSELGHVPPAEHEAGFVRDCGAHLLTAFGPTARRRDRVLVS
jgi:transposase InsO family protein